MSTVSPPPGPANTAAGNPTAARGANAGQGKFDQLIDERIGEACRALWWAELVRTLLRLVLGGLALLGVWLVVDHWIYSPGVAVRTLLAAGAVIAVGLYLWKYAVPLLRSSVRPEYAARAMERDLPDLRQALTSYVTLREIGRDPDLRSRVIRTVGSSTAARLQTYQDLPAEATGTMRWWIATAVALAVLAAYAVASPKNAFQSAARLAAPLASIDAPRRVSIENVTPGDTEAIAGRAIEVSATVKGLRDGEEVDASWMLPSGAESTSLKYDDDLRAFRGQIDLPHSVSGIISYRIEAGDAVAGPYELSVQDVPVVALQSVQYQPPSYTGRAPHTTSSGAITAIDGTEVAVRAKTNRPVAKAKLEFNPRAIGDQVRATAGATEMAIAEDGTSLSVTFRLRSAYGRSAAVEPESYRIKVWDDAQQSNPDPIIYPIRVIADLPPEVAITLPTQTPSEVDIDSQQIIEVHAADPDFGLSEVALEIRSGIDVIARPVIWPPQNAQDARSRASESQTNSSRGTRVLEFPFRPSRYDLQINDKVQVVAVATDNRRIEGLPGLEPNVARTDPIELKITPGDPNAAAESSSDSSSEAGDTQSGTNENASAESDSSQAGKQQGESGQQGSGAGGTGEGQQQQGEAESGEGSSGSGSSEGASGEGSENQSSSGTGSQANESSDATAEANPSDSQSGQGDQAAESQSQRGQNQGTQNQAAQNGDSPSPSSAEQASQRQGSSSSPTEDASTSPDPSGAGDSAADGSPGEQQDAGTSQPGADASQQNDGSPQPGSGSDRQGDATNQPPQHDGETFERIKEYLDKKREQEAGSDQKNSDAGGDNQNQSGAKQSDNGQGQGEAAAGQREQETADSGGSQPSGSQRSEGSQQETSQQNESGQQGAAKDSSAEQDSRRQGQSSPQQDSTQEQSPSDPDSPSSAGDDSSPGREPSTVDESDPTSNDFAEEGSGGAESDSGQSPPAESGPQGSNNQAEGAEQQADEEASAPEGSGGSEQQQDSSGSEGTPSQSDGTQSAKEGSPAESQSSESQSSDDGPSDGTPSEGSQGDASAGESAASPGDTASPSADGGSGSEQTRADQPQAGDPDVSGNASGQAPGASSTAADGRSTSGDGQAASGEGDAGGTSPPPAEPNLEYTREATDMVLDYLEETRDAPDRELLDELNWDEQDLQRFTQRWQNLRESAKQPSADPGGTQEMQKALESLGLRPNGGAAPTQMEKADTLRSLRDSGNRRPPPPAFRDAFDAFRRAVGE